MLTTLAEKIAPPHTAILVVDMQNDFCDDEGACAHNGLDLRSVQAAVPTIDGLLTSARSAGATVIFIRVAHDETTNSEVWYERRRGRKADVATEGTWGVDWYDVLQPRAGDIVVTKHRFSAFIDTPLDLILRSRGIRTIVVTGTTTETCVESTVRHGHMLDYYMVLPRDAAASSDAAAHDAAVAVMAKHFGDVVSADEVRAVWSAPPQS